MRDLDEITRDLAQVTDDLLALDDGDFAERFRLLSRQDALRREADRYEAEFDARRPVADIRAELAELSRRRAAEVAQRSGRNLMSGPSGTGASAGAVSGEMVTLSLRTDPDSIVERLTARIRALESLLVARSIDQDAASDTAAVTEPTAEPSSA